MIGESSMKALMGGRPDEFLSLATTEDIRTTQKCGIVRVVSASPGGGSSKLIMPGAEVGDLVRLQGDDTSSTSFVLAREAVTAGTAQSADVFLLGSASRTIGKGDFIILQRYEDTTGGGSVLLWREFMFSNVS